MGKGSFLGRDVNFKARTYGDMGYQRDGLNSWQLKVFKSGTTQLLSLNDELSTDKDFECNQKNVFKVLDSYNKYVSYKGDWEESVTKIKLTLGQCQEEGNKKECKVEMANGVGLQFNPEYKPTVILWT